MQNKQQDPEVVIRTLRQQVEDLKYELNEMRKISANKSGDPEEEEIEKIMKIKDAYGLYLTEARFLWALSSGILKYHLELVSDMQSRAEGSNFTKVLVCIVRKKLRISGSKIKIKTYFGAGYRIVSGLDELRQAAASGVIVLGQGF